MHSYTERICRQLGMSSQAQEAVEEAYRRVICARNLLLWRRHTDEERAFLRMMLELALAQDEALCARASDVAGYYSANYSFEWVHNKLTAPARTQARDIILAGHLDRPAGDDLAGAVAFVRCHHRTLGLGDVTDVEQMLEVARVLLQHRQFEDAWPERREELGLETDRPKA